MGKHKPIYDPSTDCGDYVVAVGCHDLHTTGKKRMQKKYYTHNTRPGSLKSMTMDKMFEKWGGGEVLRRAVKGMLPKNRLQSKRLARLKSGLSFFPWVRNGYAWHLANWIGYMQLSRALLIPTRITLSSSATNRLLEMPLKSRMLSRLPKRRHRLVAGACLFLICNSYLSLYDRSSSASVGVL